MDRETILKKDPADWTEEEQLFIIQDTDNSLKPKDLLIDQPEQSPNWQPDPSQVIEKL